MSMQTIAPLEAHSILPLHLSLGEPTAYLETTGYVAWADALGRAGVRFSELPDPARERLREWLTLNAFAPSWKAPRWVVRDSAFAGESNGSPKSQRGVALSLETGPDAREQDHPLPLAGVSTTVQYEFKSLGGNLESAREERRFPRERSGGTHPVRGCTRNNAQIARSVIGSLWRRYGNQKESLLAWIRARERQETA